MQSNISENELKDLIGKVLQEINLDDCQPASSGVSTPAAQAAGVDHIADSDLRDITEVPMQEYFAIEEPENKAEYLKLKAKTPARLGIGRVGSRYNTESMLRFRADHAVAIDAVFNEVPQAFVDEHGLVSVQTLVEDKDMYVTRPDLGRVLSDAECGDCPPASAVRLLTCRLLWPMASPHLPLPPTCAISCPP